MPYITKEHKEHIDQELDRLIFRLESIDAGEGDIAYTLTRIVDYFYGVTIGNRPSNFSIMSAGIGVLDCVKEEFRRRRLNPYEDAKIKENGDVFI